MIITYGLSYSQEIKDSVKLDLPDSLISNVEKVNLENPLDTLLAVDSLQTSAKEKVDSVKRKVTEYPQKSFQSANDKVNSKSDSVTNTIESKVAEVTKKVEVPDDEISGKNLNESLGTSQYVPEADAPSVNDLETPDDFNSIEELPTDEISNIQKNSGMDNISSEVEDIETIPEEELDNLKNIEEVNDVAEITSDIKEVNGDAKEYSESLESAREGDYSEVEERVEEEAEGQVSQVEGMGEIEAQKQEIEDLKTHQEEYQQQIEEYKEQKVIKNQLKQRAAQRGMEFFTQHQEKLNAAQGSYGKYKKKFLKTKEEKKKWLNFKSNSMKGKGFLERLIIGGYTQFVKLDGKYLDLSPLVGYHLSGMFAIGFGGTYRLGLGSDGFSPHTNERTYGYRAYLDGKAYKGFYGHVEFESIRTNVPVQISNSSDEITREWVNSFIVGIGKKYKIRNKVNGYIQALHNFSYDINKTPYPRKLMIRIGIEGIFSGGNRKKEVSIDPIN